MLRIGMLTAAGAVLTALVLSRDAVRWCHQLLASRSPSTQLPDGAVADVAIVLGYALFRNGSLTEPLKGRVQAGVDAFLQGRARHLIFSGAHPGGVVTKLTEANVMREYAEELFGRRAIAQGRWLEEGASTSTYENALFSLKLAQQHRWTSVLVVTSPFHQVRSQLVFKRLATAAAAAHSGSKGWWQPTKVYVDRTAFVPHAGHFWWPLDRLVDWWDFVREVAALVYYLGRSRL